MKITALVEALVMTGATPEMILAAVRTAESSDLAALEQAREKTRARVEKWRAAKAGNVTDGHVTVRNDSRAGVTRVEDKPLPTEIEPQEKVKNTRSADADAFKSELADLDPERMKALIEHRRRKRAAITGRAAQMFRSDAAKCGLSLAEAVDTCIRRNWITVEPGWLATPPARGSPQPIPSQADVFAMIARRSRDEPQRDDSPGPRQAIPYLPAIEH